MQNLEKRARLVFSLRQAGIQNIEIINAMESLDRADFIEGIFKDRAYDDVPLPIESGQTISQPSVVAKMTEALNVTKKCKVLEIGTGSGYQTAILSKLARRVYSVERVKTLAKSAQIRLNALSYSNIVVSAGDGSLGLPNQAPFDRILLTAASEDPPSTLLAQLKTGGIMVLPVGQSDATQTLIRIHKTELGLDYEELGEVRFVPLLAGKE